MRSSCCLSIWIRTLFLMKTYSNMCTHLTMASWIQKMVQHTLICFAVVLGLMPVKHCALFRISHWHLLLLVLHIVNIVFFPCISEGMTVFLKHLMVIYSFVFWKYFDPKTSFYDPLSWMYLSFSTCLEYEVWSKALKTSRTSQSPLQRNTK